MSICCGKIDKTMQAGKLISLVYLMLFMGLLAVSTLIMVIWSVFRNELKSIPRILLSFWLVFLWESRRLTFIPPEKKARTAGKIFRLSPRISGYFFKYADSFLIFSFLCVTAIGILLFV
ncbi:MAG: hypothetical protein AB1498_05560 [bacterium]